MNTILYFSQLNPIVEPGGYLLEHNPLYFQFFATSAGLLAENVKHETLFILFVVIRIKTGHQRNVPE